MYTYGSANSFINKRINTLKTIDYKIMIFHFLSGLVTCQYHIPEFRHPFLSTMKTLLVYIILKIKTILLIWMAQESM